MAPQNIVADSHPRWCLKQDEFANNEHAKQYHSGKITLQFAQSLSVTAYRQPDGKFHCPVCRESFARYDATYNHASRKKCPNGSLAEYLTEQPTHRGETESPMEVDDQDQVPSSPQTPCSDDSHSSDILWRQVESPIVHDSGDESIRGRQAASSTTDPSSREHTSTRNLPATSNQIASYSTAQKEKRTSVDGSHRPRGGNVIQAGSSIPTQIDGDESIIFKIPYGTPEVVTSSDLNTINLVLFKLTSRPIYILICPECLLAILPPLVRQHRVSRHQDRVKQGDIDKYLEGYRRYLIDGASDIHGPFDAVPGISVMKHGWKCPAEGCYHARKSHQNMQRHISSTHGDTQEKLIPLPSPVQALFESDSTYYPVNLPISQEAPVERRELGTAAAAVFEAYEATMAEISFATLDDPAHLSPFLAKYKWHLAIGDAKPGDIQSLVAAPRDDEPYLHGLASSVQSHYTSIADDVDNMQGVTTILRWIKSPKDTIVDSPFRVPMRRGGTLMTYVNTMIRLLAFALRVHHKHRNKITLTGREHVLPKKVVDACTSLRRALALAPPESATSEAHDLIISLLHESSSTAIPDGSYKTTILFIIFSNVLSSGMIRDPNRVNGTLSELKWPFRAAAFRRIITLAKAAQVNMDTLDEHEQVNGADLLSSILDRERQYLTEGGFTVMSEILEIGHFANFLADQSVLMPRVFWNDDEGEELVMDGHSMTMAAYRIMYGGLLDRARNILDNDILLGLETPDISTAHIFDDLANTTPGYSFITDHRNPFHKHSRFLLDAMLDSDTYGTRFFYAEHTNDSGISWNIDGIMKLFDVAGIFSGEIFGLFQFGSGQPARGTEICVMTLINTVLHPRSVYWFDNLVNIVSLYNKVQTATDSQRLISRAMEPEAGQLFIRWNTFVIPTLVCLARTALPRFNAAVRLRTLMFTSLKRKWTSDDLSSILSSISAPSVGEGGLGVSMGLAPVRHFLIAITKRHFRGEVDRYGFAEELLSHQAGHEMGIDDMYALSMMSIRHVPETRLINFSRLSRLHHGMVRPSPNSPSPTSTVAVSSAENVVRISRHDIQELITGLTRSGLAAQISELLAPRIQASVAEGFASVTPIGSWPTTTGADRVSERWSAILDSTSISPERYKELRRLLANPNAAFKSKTQAVVSQLVAERTRDLLVIQPTGAGKTIPIMMAALNQSERDRGLVTLMIAPLLALVSDLFKRMTAAGIRVVKWTDMKDGATTTTAAVVLVNVDSAVSEAFLTFARSLHKLKHLARLVVDEVHYRLTAIHYRPLIQALCHIRAIAAVPMLLLTASLPPSETQGLIEMLHLSTTSTVVIRQSVVRPNIRHSLYRLLKAESGSCIARFCDDAGEVWRIDQYIRDFNQKLSPRDRILVFCLYIKDVENLSNALSCWFVHGKVTNRDKVLQQWMSGSGSRILVATCAISAGVDYSSVRMVLHWGAARSMIDQDQEIGRAGRDDEVAYSVVLWDPDARDFEGEEKAIPGEREQTKWLESGTSQCLRRETCRYIDGCERSCLDMGIAVLCQICEKNVQAIDAPAPKSQLKDVIGHEQAQPTQPSQTTRLPSPIATTSELLYEDTSDLAPKRKRSLDANGPPRPKKQMTASEAPMQRSHSARPTKPPPAPSIQRSQSAQGDKSETPSVGIQIATAQARQLDSASQSLQRQARHSRSNTLSAMVTLNALFLGGDDTCPPCWVSNLPYDHSFPDCTRTASGWGNMGGAYRRFKSRLDIPSGTCYHCAQLQETPHGPDNAPACRLKIQEPKSDYLRQLSFAVFMSSDAGTSCRAYFAKLNSTMPTELLQYCAWLTTESTPGFSFRSALNLHRMVEWALVYTSSFGWNTPPLSPSNTAQHASGSNTTVTQATTTHPLGVTGQAASTSTTTPSVRNFLTIAKSQGIAEEDAIFIEKVGANCWDDIKELLDEDWASVKAPICTIRRIKKIVSRLED